jgi:tRNA threonylcarbamoyladenosine biosynthesis protein TsaB
MLVLAIDTTLTACSVALWRAGESMGVSREPAARNQAEVLAPLVERLLEQAGVTPTQIDRVAVTTGPGSFTGLRVGLAFARAFAQALDRPCIGVSTLEVLAAGAAAQRTVAAISMAGSLFCAAWDGRRAMSAPHRVTAPDVFLDALASGDWVITGPGAAALQHLRPDWPVVVQAQPDPFVLAGLAATRDRAGNPPDPLYLRGHGALLPGGQVPEGAEP